MEIIPDRTSTASSCNFSAREKMLLKRARKGDSIAQYKLGSLYLTADPPFQNFKKAFRWFIASSLNDCLPACLEAGKLLLAGSGIRKNYRKAFDLIRKSAENYEPGSFLVYAGLFRNGTGTKKQSGEAFLWTLRAAESGDKQAFLPLGLHYLKGAGTDKNIELAAVCALNTPEGDPAGLKLLMNALEKGARHPDLVQSAKTRLSLHKSAADEKTLKKWKKILKSCRSFQASFDIQLPQLFSPEPCSSDSDGAEAPPGEEPALGLSAWFLSQEPSAQRSGAGLLLPEEPEEQKEAEERKAPASPLKAEDQKAADRPSASGNPADAETAASHEELGSIGEISDPVYLEETKAEDLKNIDGLSEAEDLKETVELKEAEDL